MSARSNPSILDSRHDQIFPKLDEVEIERLLRFGEVSCFAAGESLAEVGKVGRGLLLILAGAVDVIRRDQLGHHDLIVTHEPGSFLGELAQLAGRPSLVDAHATRPGRALIISPERLRALLVGEAEIGERIMRALILRRVGLIETGIGGPIIIGRADHPVVLRLEGFLSRNGHPFQHLDPEVDPEAKTLIERFHLDSSELPIVLCPNGKLVRSPSEDELAVRAQHDGQLGGIEVKALDQGFRFRIDLGIEMLKRMAVARQKTLEAENEGMIGATDDDRAAGASLDQTDPAQNQGPHDPLADFGFADKQRPQPLGRYDQSPARARRIGIHQGRPTGQLCQLSHEGAGLMGHDEIVMAQLIASGDVDFTGEDDNEPAADLADLGQ